MDIISHCSECSSDFISKEHHRTHKGTYVLLKKTKIFYCDICLKEHTNKCELNRHVLSHNSDLEIASCPLCQEKGTKSNLISHFKNIHDIEIKSECLTFSNMIEFDSWKSKTEGETGCKYLRILKEKQKIIEYCCYRSGQYKTRGTGKKPTKILGSNKINGFCPAKLRIKEADDSKIRVNFVKTHVGHDCELESLTLTKANRSNINKISAEAPSDATLDKVKFSINNELQRINDLTHKDLLKVNRKFNSRRANVGRPTTKVVQRINKCWVKSIMPFSGDTVRVCKSQDQLSKAYPLLSREDSVLILMSENQEELLKTYGNNIICVDGIPKSNCHELEFTTLMVLDEFQQAFPCAFMVSNRTDVTIIEFFFTTIFDNFEIYPGTFVSADIYYNAWVKLMPPVENRLYCCWQVDREWRKNLNKVKGLEKQLEVYRGLRTLVEEKDENSFTLMIVEFMNKLHFDQDTTEFGDYFQQYHEIVKLWANCFRIGLNTDMHLERMFITLEHIYMKGKKSKSLDKGIKFIVQLTKDKIDGCSHIKIKKREDNYKLNAIEYRHIRSTRMQMKSVTEENGHWKVKSENSCLIYTVSTANQKCKCKLRCEDCDYCIHSFTCTCPDSSVKSNMCKHIHLVGMI